MLSFTTNIGIVSACREIIVTYRRLSMRSLANDEIQVVNGAGVIAATAALPVNAFIGVFFSPLAIITSPIAARQGDGFIDCANKVLYHASFGVRQAYELEKKAYNW